MAAVAVPRGAPAKEPVRLTLPGASAQRSGKDVVFRCEAVIVNNTGAVLKVQSTFYSAFDGLELVVLTAKGKELRRQSYLHHQSPHSPQGRQFPLNKGENRKTLVFPVLGLPKGTRVLKIRLVGTLPGSKYKGVLRSDVLTIPVLAEGVPGGRD